VLLALITAYAISDIALAAFAHGRAFDVPQVTLMALGISQAALIGLWLGIGRMPFASRAGLSSISLFAIWGSLAFGLQGPDLGTGAQAIIAAFTVATSTAVALTGLVMRRIGVFVGQEGEAPTSVTPARMQFTLLDLIQFTTGVALLCVGIPTMRSMVPDAKVVDSIALSSMAIAGTTTGAAWGALSRQRIGWRLLAAPFVVAMALLAYYVDRGWDMPIIMLVQAAISTATLLVVRTAHFRLYVPSRDA